MIGGPEPAAPDLPLFDDHDRCRSGAGGGPGRRAPASAFRAAHDARSREAQDPPAAPACRRGPALTGVAAPRPRGARERACHRVSALRPSPVKARRRCDASARAALDLAIIGAIDAIVVSFTLQAVRPDDCRAEHPAAACRCSCFFALINGGYFAIFTAAGGQTIGKMAFGLRVVGHADLPVSARAVGAPRAGLPGLRGVVRSRVRSGDPERRRACARGSARRHTRHSRPCFVVGRSSPHVNATGAADLHGRRRRLLASGARHGRLGRGARVLRRDPGVPDQSRDRRADPRRAGLRRRVERHDRRAALRHDRSWRRRDRRSRRHAAHALPAPSDVDRRHRRLRRCSARSTSSSRSPRVDSRPCMEDGG